MRGIGHLDDWVSLHGGHFCLHRDQEVGEAVRIGEVGRRADVAGVEADRSCPGAVAVAAARWQQHTVPETIQPPHTAAHAARSEEKPAGGAVGGATGGAAAGGTWGQARQGCARVRADLRR